SELFVNQIPTKDKIWAEVIPGLRETYRFDTEQAYYQMYQSARFAFTWKKGGWDCLRHYEIIANGCIPVFRDINLCPDATLANFPKSLFQRVNKELIPWKETPEYEELYHKLAEQILDYSREHASAEGMGKKFLEIAGLYPGARVLVLTCDPRPNYSREFTFIGLNRVLKASGGICISYPELKPIYSDFPQNEAQKLYGKGFGYTRRLERSHTEELKVWTDETVKTSILTKKWDFILFGKIGVDEPTLGSLPELPFWNEIVDLYPSDKIGFLYGGDHIQDLKDTGSIHTRHLLRHARFGKCFVRELNQ
ncbi:MAG TPA: hypothetical protein VLA71_03675, partial [Algoriphagus sp.]|nr:hypothetical protein [Algoriphagus sp.]